jgi:hypothetical protein
VRNDLLTQLSRLYRSDPIISPNYQVLDELPQSLRDGNLLNPLAPCS